VKAGSHTGESFTAWPCLPGPTMATLGAEVSARRLGPQRLLRLHLLRDSSRGPDPISCHAVKTAAIASYTSDVISSALSALWLPTTATDRVFYSFSSANPSDALSDHPSREETVVEHDRRSRAATAEAGAGASNRYQVVMGQHARPRSLLLAPRSFEGTEQGPVPHRILGGSATSRRRICDERS
jgi:hypothetical protein